MWPKTVFRAAWESNDSLDNFINDPISGPRYTNSRHWSRQGEGSLSASVYWQSTIAKATLCKVHLWTLQWGAETVPDCLIFSNSVPLLSDTRWETRWLVIIIPGTISLGRTRPGPGTWKQIGWNFQIIPTFLPVGPLLPHTLHGSSLLHTWEQHANSKTSPHTTAIREGVNMVPTTTNFSNSDFPFSSLSTSLKSWFNFLCRVLWADVSSDKLSMKLHHLFRTILHLFEQTVQQLDTRSFFFTSKAIELRWKMI